jgi:hypothetical protein
LRTPGLERGTAYLLRGMLDFSPCMLLRLLLALPEPDFELLLPGLALARLLALLEALEGSCTDDCSLLLLLLSDLLLLRLAMEISFCWNRAPGCARRRGSSVGRWGEPL